MPEPTSNKMTVKLGQRSQPNGNAVPCVSLDPPQLRLRKRDGRTAILQADPGNTGPVIITFNQNRARDLFETAPKSPVTLTPGNPVTFVLKEHLGPAGLRLTPRGDFTDRDPAFARTFDFNHDPAQECRDGGHHVDWHFEC